MRVLRGRADTRAADRELTATMLAEAADTGESAVRVWRPGRQLAFGRRDVRADGYDQAAKIARDRGFPPVERSVGGRAVAYTETTVAFATARPIPDMRTGMGERYDDATRAVQRVLWKLGIPAQRGEPADSFCPGDYSLQWKGKLAGLAQRVRKDAALVSGVVLVADHEEIAAVLDSVYGALGVPFDPNSVGSVERVAGVTDPDRVVQTVEDALVGDTAVTVEDVSASHERNRETAGRD